MTDVIPKAEETKNRIKAAAMDLFVERGFASTTMREIAARADMAVGATYYYFKSKEAIVMEFYIDSQDEVAQKIQDASQNMTGLKDRLYTALKTQFDYFGTYRKFFGVLSRIAAEPSHPLSPFSKETELIRNRSIQVFKAALDGSDVKVQEDLSPHLPHLLWLYHMGIIFFWLHDESPDQQKTKLLLEESLEIVTHLIRLARYPLMGSLRSSVVKLLENMNPEGGKP